MTLRTSRSVTASDRAMRMPRRRRLRLILASVLCALTGTVLIPIPSASAAAPGNLNVEILSSQSLAGQPYVFARAAMSGNLTRPDGTSAKFKVPMWLVYPNAESECNGFGVVEPIHRVGRLPAFMNQLSYAQEGNRNRLAWPAIADGASLFGQEHGGYVWAGVVWHKGMLHDLKGTTFQGIPIDSSYHMSNPWVDPYLVLAAASLVERDPAAFIADDPGGVGLPCAAEHVITGGYSNSALILRSFYFQRMNTGLATDPRFGHGLVFDGAIHGALTGNHCVDFAGATYLCDGPTPTDQGKVITIHPEYDVQQSSLLTDDPDDGYVRGLSVRGEGPNWRIYEIAGVSHIARWSQDLKALGIKPASMPDQNYADARPVFRAMVEHLRRWITDDVEPPPNALLEGEVMDLSFDGNPTLPWFMPSAFIPPDYDLDGDYDLNSDGGIRLPHVRTMDFGAPLGLYRGPACNNPDPLIDPFSCPTWWDFDLPPAIEFGGAFYPYPAVEDELSASGLPNPCEYYGSHAEYLSDAQAAADYARDQEWILADDIDRMVAEAEEAAARYPGCVPAP